MQAGWTDQACLDYAAQHFTDFDRAQAVADIALFKGRQQVLYKVSTGSLCWRCQVCTHTLAVRLGGLGGLLSTHVPYVWAAAPVAGPCNITVWHASLTQQCTHTSLLARQRFAHPPPCAACLPACLPACPPHPYIQLPRLTYPPALPPPQALLHAGPEGCNSREVLEKAHALGLIRAVPSSTSNTAPQLKSMEPTVVYVGKHRNSLRCFKSVIKVERPMHAKPSRASDTATGGAEAGVQRAGSGGTLASTGSGGLVSRTSSGAAVVPGLPMLVGQEGQEEQQQGQQRLFGVALAPTAAAAWQRGGVDVIDMIDDDE